MTAALAGTTVNESAIVQITAGQRSFSLEFPHPDDHIARIIRQTGTFYEAEMLNDLQSRLFFPSVAADIGAHVGNHTIFLAGVLGLTTYAFEPNPTNFSLLRSNLAANALQDRCLVHNVALGARRSQGTIERVSNANSGMSRVRAAPGGSVEILSLDSAFARLARLDVLKVDVEGGEIDVLRGAADTFRRLRPVAYLEVTPENFGQASELLSSYGYLCWKRFNATATFLFLPKERLGR